MTQRSSNYDKFPQTRVPDSEGACVEGWDAIGSRLGKLDGVVAVECYPGTDVQAICCELVARLNPELVLDTRDLLRCPDEIEALVAPFLGGDDPVFGYMSGLSLIDFFDQKQLCRAREAVSQAGGRTLVVGPGATLVHEGDVLVYADLPRWEAQTRFRRNASSNLGADNAEQKWSLQYKRAFFVDWRVADRHKRPLIDRWDFVLDTSTNPPKLANGEAVRRGLEICAHQPFRVVPFFDPAPWGGQWMKEVCDLDSVAPNYGWCFDCVPEENGLRLAIGSSTIEIPAIDLVFYRPRQLLGDKVYARFGDEFPIRFDFLDTMGGGNLSFQVHPTTEYIQGAFGMHYTQDESYYILDSGPGGSVYLGVADDVNPGEMVEALERAQGGEEPFDADRYAAKWPAKKHDHFLIPAGTVHCSCSDTMVLEISATPYIFTFKLWDWNRLGLDGKPRPIYLEHGRNVIDWSRNASYAKRHLINRFEPLEDGEERTGLHDMEFIETRRQWFAGPVQHDTNGGVNVLNLVEGEAAVVESPTGAFEPFTVHFAETFIVPASVGKYSIRPAVANPEKPHATIRAFVRT
jgi:mannose-6-phosphate isomerase class I